MAVDFRELIRYEPGLPHRTIREPQGGPVAVDLSRLSFSQMGRDRLHRQFPELPLARLSIVVSVGAVKTPEKAMPSKPTTANSSGTFKPRLRRPRWHQYGKPVVVGKERSWLVGKRQDTIERRLSTR